MRLHSVRPALLACALGLAAALPASAAQIIPSGITGTGSWNGNIGKIIDNAVPPEMTVWTDTNHNVWWTAGQNPGTSFIINLGGLYSVQDALISIDNNDRYRVEYSTDGVNFTSLFTVEVTDGEITPGQGGMDTMTTYAGAEFVSNIDFSAVLATHIKVYAEGPDGAYSIGELQVFGDAVPAPPALVLAALGLPVLFRASRRRSRVA